MSLNVRIQGSVTCPKCGTLVPVGTKPNGKKKNTKQGIATKIDKKIVSTKKNIKKFVAGLLRLAFIIFIICILYLIFIHNQGNY